MNWSCSGERLLNGVWESSKHTLKVGSAVIAMQGGYDQFIVTDWTFVNNFIHFSPDSCCNQFN
jgi:hypothetical protein